MDTHYLTYILTIADRRNMTKAARELFVSQSSLSQYLSKLEQELGTSLFFRARGELIPTPAGELYLKAARQVLSIKNQLYKDISALENRGSIAIGTTSQFGLGILAKVIPLFRSDYPDYTVEITEASHQMLTKMILEERLDFGLMAANSMDSFPADTAEILRVEEVLLAIPREHSYCSSNYHAPLSWEELTKFFQQDNFILTRPGSTIFHLTELVFQACQFHPSTSCEINNIPTALKMAAAHGGITFVPESCINHDLPLVYIHLTPALSRLNLLVRKQSLAYGPAEKCFYSHILHHFQGEDFIS
ncbi:LysR family transcriptional regulator [Lachnospiraceae bacterium 62-35]